MAIKSEELKAKRIEIRDVGCIRVRDIDVGEHGFIARGKNRSGKSTILRALRAAFESEGLSADAIRIGADEGEVMVDLGALRAIRTLRRDGTNTLKVTNADGLVLPKPQTRLRELLGQSAFDAAKFFTAEKKERRKMLIEAMPIVVSDEMLSRFDPKSMLTAQEKTGHGLVVLERARKLYYAARTEANRESKEAERVAVEREEEASRAAKDDGSTTGDAEAARERAERELHTLIDRASEAAAAAERTAKSRARIVELREEAEANRVLVKNGPTDSIIDHVTKVRDDAWAEVKRLRAELDAAQLAYDDAEAAARKVAGEREECQTAHAFAVKLDKQATELEETLGALPSAPTEEAIAAATKAVEEARAAALKAKEVEIGRGVRKDAEEARAIAKKKQAVADALDKIVTRLTDEAPQELMKLGNGIPGVTLRSEDDEILLEGKRVDDLSGAEQMKFAIDIAKRLNRAKIIIVDKLEALDPDQIDAFIDYATADGWQLIATCVDRGDIVIEPIGGEAAE